MPQKRNVALILILLVSTILLVWVFWRYDQRIRKINRKKHQPLSSTQHKPSKLLSSRFINLKY